MPNTIAGNTPMRTPRPLRWIEEAEARQVIAIAQDKAPPPPFAPVVAKTAWTERLRRWVAAGPASPNPDADATADAIIESRRS
jgi:hypothetical protein